MRRFDLAPLYRATVGFDRIADLVDRARTADAPQPAYPPYNIEKTDENAYRISIAVAGFTPEDLSVEVKEGALFVAARKRDGYVDVNTGAGPRTLDNDQNQDFYTLRGQALYTPADGFNVNVIADYSKRQESCCAGVQIIDGPTAAIVRALSPGGASGVAIPAAPFDRMAYANRLNTQNIEDAGISAEANWDLEWLGGATLTSITAYRDWKRLYGSDGDFTNVDIIYSPNDGSNRTQFKQFSQELRLAGATEKLNWLVGAFYANEKLISNNSQVRYGSQFETYASLLFSGGTNPNLVSTLQGRPTGTSYAPGAGSKIATTRTVRPSRCSRTTATRSPTNSS